MTLRLVLAWAVSAYYFAVSHRHLRSFPTRRSSDLRDVAIVLDVDIFVFDTPPQSLHEHVVQRTPPTVTAHRDGRGRALEDRKSTRLNSSHANISYAVFCLKKKKAGTQRSTIALGHA